MMVQITGDEYLDLLMDRLKVWCDDPVIMALYEEMYQNYIDSGVFESNTATVMEIVDNDWANWCDVVDEDDEAWLDILHTYDAEENEVTIGGRYYCTIEVFDDENKIALIRW